VNIHPLYRRAEEADEAYTAVIHHVYGLRATRWTISTREHLVPEIRAAYDAKVRADTAWLDALGTDRTAIELVAQGIASPLHVEAVLNGLARKENSR